VAFPAPTSRADQLWKFMNPFTNAAMVLQYSSKFRQMSLLMRGSGQLETDSVSPEVDAGGALGESQSLAKIERCPPVNVYAFCIFANLRPAWVICFRHTPLRLSALKGVDGFTNVDGGLLFPLSKANAIKVCDYRLPGIACLFGLRLRPPIGNLHIGLPSDALTRALTLSPYNV
jgi:hypothetical protein